MEHHGVDLVVGDHDLHRVGGELVLFRPQHRPVVHDDGRIGEVVYQAVAHALQVAAVIFHLIVCLHEAGGTGAVGKHPHGVGMKVQRVFLVGHDRQGAVGNIGVSQLVVVFGHVPLNIQVLHRIVHGHVVLGQTVFRVSPVEDRVGPDHLLAMLYEHLLFQA